MRKRKIITALIFLCMSAGLLSMVIAFFAYQLGLDNNPVMGQKRQLLAVMGALLLILPVFIRLTGEWMQRRVFSPLRLLLQRLWESAPVRKIEDAFEAFERTRFVHFLNGNAAFWTLFACAVVIFVSVWYLTAGRMTRFTPYSSYINWQADGFLHGQLGLIIEPTPELALLSDPYEWKAREGLDYIWDASYYQGKYYFYWGPVPSLTAAAIKLVRPAEIDDQFILLGFYTGLLLVFSALLYWLRKTFFPKAPAWILFWLILACGLSTPVFWLINRPKIYETAIASAQFFLLLGLYAAARGLYSKNHTTAWLALAGFAWGASVGSRNTAVFAVVMMSLVVSIELFRRWRRSRSEIRPAIALFLPLVFWAAGLAWFNYARFGNVFESGLTYQLTGEALPEDGGMLLEPANFIPNTYLSVFNPYIFVTDDFPFFFAPYIKEADWPAWIRLPFDYYYSEPVVGVLYTMPVLFLLFMVLFPALGRFWGWVNEREAKVDTNGVPVPWWLWSLVIAGFFFSFLPLMLFVMATMRYLVDFVPLLMLLAGMVILNAFNRASLSPWVRRLLALLVIALCVATIVIGLLINFRNGDTRFERNNPQLYYRMARFFLNLN